MGGQEMETVKISNLSFSYPESDKKALDNISLTVNSGDFVVICGRSGCGKSTLLRQMKPVLAPHGVREGDILFEGQPLDKLNKYDQAARIGFVSQSPDNQIVTDKVWHELAFGLESLGADTDTIRRRVAEMAAFFGIEGWFHKKVDELSGGQKQLLNLASVMVMQPSLLLLDEPTGQLDPIAAADFLSTLGKINREFSTTVILSEHRLEDALPLATQAVVMDKGAIICTGTPDEIGKRLKETNNPMFDAMPSAMRIWAALDGDGKCPITVNDGRRFFEGYAENHKIGELAPERQFYYPEKPILSAENVWFRYGRDLPDVVKGLTLEIHKGEFFALLGSNGAGKTTALKALAGLNKQYRGEIKRDASIGVLPQNPQTLFVKKTVREDLSEILDGKCLSKEEKQKRLERAVSLCRLNELLDRHPYDLSGGEQQRAALAKVLLCEPELLMLDEPTKGFDAEFKKEFAAILNALISGGVAIFMVSHDIEFCAEYAHRCALFFDGGIVTSNTPRKFFSGNSFYTTAANRISRGILPQAVTSNEVISACGIALPQDDGIKRDFEPLAAPKESSPDYKPKKLPLWRKLIAAVSGAAAAAVVIKALCDTDLTKLVYGGMLTDLAKGQLWMYAALIAALIVFALSLGRRSAPPISVQTALSKRKLKKRTLCAAVMILLLIPLTLFIGVYYLGNAKYYFISLLVLLECMLPFFLIFEGRKPQARELIIISVLCAVGVAGRAAFFMLPQFKPVMALSIIAGVAFGGETGFLVGSVTMLASNMFFSQGPLTPWQMFAMGIIGFLAGVLFKKGLLRRSRLSLSIFGAVCAILIYGGIMNPASMIVYQRSFNLNIILTYYITGFPFDCVHAAATALFLWFAAEPMLEKLDRIKVKYGLVE